MDNAVLFRPAWRAVLRSLLASALLFVLAGQSSPVFALKGFEQSGTLLRLRSAEFDPLTQPAPDLSMLQEPSVPEDEPSLWLIQFTGPIQDAWLDAVQRNDLAVIQYVPDNAYLVWGSEAYLSGLSSETPLRWFGQYRPEYALHPELVEAITNQGALQADEKAIDDIAVVVQVAAPGGAGADIQPIITAAKMILRPAEQFRSIKILRLVVPTGELASLAAQPGVLDVSPLPEYHKLDEIQGQILAGNLNTAGTGPNGPGYLSWLLSLGMSTNPEDYPIVDVTDDGIDDGDNIPQHADFYTLGDKSRPDRLVYNDNWTNDASADGRGGHGNLNASIVSGYNNLTGNIYQDPNGYRRGLGINPFGRFGGSKVFSNSGAWGLTDSLMALVAQSYQQGARISSNSWGSSTQGAYSLDDQIYDALVRDADYSQAGNQEMLLLFAAGNSGPNAGSIDSPGNAKNVITVGASENYRPNREAVEGDQCSLTQGGAEQEANNLQEIADFSSRGPTDDGRIKPDLVAPGTTILGAASQASGYSGEGVCVRYYPAGQTLYAASSGTSHSTPAVAGAASLLYHHYQTRYAVPPSPAMIKAYLVNSARGLTSTSAGSTLPSQSQGFGMVDLGRMFDTTQRYLIDQTELFHVSGDVFESPGQIQNPEKPLRVTLAWTDAPGSSVSAAYVNDLDLEVVIDGQTYLGNVFSGQYSQSGGMADFRNNVESVFLPAGVGSSFTIRVKAHNLAGDGVPGNDDTTDQDFALVVYNANIQMGVVRGQVRLQPGDSPATGASVWATSSEGRRQFTTVQENGAYSLTLYADTYTIGAWKYGYTAVEETNLVVGNNQTIVRDFNLNAAPNYILQGCVRDQATGSGLAAGISVLTQTGQHLREVTTTTDDPCYQTALAAGNYLVSVASRLHTQTQAEISLTGDLEQNFYLAATTTDGLLLGRVTDSLNGSALASARVFVQPGGYERYTDSDGRYELQVPPGEYEVTVAARFHPRAERSGVVVRQSNQTDETFQMLTSRLRWNTTSLSPYFFRTAGGTKFQLNLENIGDGDLYFNAIERDRVAPADNQNSNTDFLVTDSRVTAAAIYQWLDASDGDPYYLADDGQVRVDLPFDFEFYGRFYSSVLIQNDGAVTFNPVYGKIPYTNLSIEQFPDTLIAPYWDDLSGDTGYVAVKTFGVAPTRKFVIEWLDRSHWASTGRATFEVVLYESSNNIKFQYQDVDFDDQRYDFGNSATVGLRSASSSYLQYSYNQPTLQDGMAVCFQAYGSAPCNRVDLSWMEIEPTDGVLAPGESTQLIVTLAAVPRSLMGLMTGGMSLYSNDPQSQPYVDIPIQVFLINNGVYLPFINYSLP